MALIGPLSGMLFCGAFILVRHAAKTVEGPAKAKELEHLVEV
ncbi:MAG: hypothetical protein ACPF83_06110 [Flavobacteriales bacterium]